MARTAAYLGFGMAEVFDMMERGLWYQAEAQLALLLVAQRRGPDAFAHVAVL